MFHCISGGRLVLRLHFNRMWDGNPINSASELFPKPLFKNIYVDWTERQEYNVITFSGTTIKIWKEKTCPARIETRKFYENYEWKNRDKCQTEKKNNFTNVSAQRAHNIKYEPTKRAATEKRRISRKSVANSFSSRLLQFSETVINYIVEMGRPNAVTLKVLDFSSFTFM